MDQKSFIDEVKKELESFESENKEEQPKKPRADVTPIDFSNIKDPSLDSVLGELFKQLNNQGRK